MAVNPSPHLAYLRLRLLRLRFLLCCSFLVALVWMSKPTFMIPNTEAIIATTSLIVSITLPHLLVFIILQAMRICTEVFLNLFKKVEINKKESLDSITLYLLHILSLLTPTYHHYTISSSYLVSFWTTQLIIYTTVLYLLYRSNLYRRYQQHYIHHLLYIVWLPFSLYSLTTTHRIHSLILYISKPSLFVHSSTIMLPHA